jgi:diguanylate cyclase (GGDEF)-like protein
VDAVDAVTDQRVLVVAVPIRAGGVHIGAVAQFLSVAGTAEVLSADLLATDHAGVTVVDRTAGTAVGTSERPIRQPAAAELSGWPVSGEWAGVDGSRRFFGSSDVADSTWRVYVGAERSAVLAQARGVLWRQLLIGVLALLALAAAVWVLNRRVARPLRAVTHAVINARAGHGQDRVSETGSAELVTLAREFNAMLDVRSAHEAQLAHQATHDPVTGLPNRVLLRDRLARALRGGVEAGPGVVAVLHCRLLRFKAVSDGLGQDAADRLLTDVADRLRSALRQGDTLARAGDDEFVVICQTSTHPGAVLVAERLQTALSDPFSGFGDTDLILGAAIGVAVADRNTAEVGQLLREADTAMQHAEQTTQPWSVFEVALHRHASQRMRDEEALRRALNGNELVVWYQPLHHVATGSLVGAEALVRWQHPQRGLVPPNEFIPLAEESGQVVPIGRFVLREACRQAADWAEAGHPIRVSVNVAVEQLHDANFRRHVDAALGDAGLPPGSLCLEITESSIMSEIGTAVGVLEGLRHIGVHVAIDDFGTGYSSLSYLPRLPVSELKIDRSFVSRLDADTGERHLVKAIIAMAGALELTVVAEGVETIDQLETLADLNCNLAQGYLLGKPMPGQVFAAHLSERRRPQLPAVPPTRTPAATPPEPSAQQRL